jgi:hypothetical protein
VEQNEEVADHDVDAFEMFKWNCLGDAVFEDWQAVWEPLWELRGSGAIAGQSELDRQVFAERALRELYRDGLIYFFRVSPSAGINVSGDAESLRLTSDEVDAALAADWWRRQHDFPSEHPDIWWGPTPAGEAAANDPPEHIRAIWLPDRSS